MPSRQQFGLVTDGDGVRRGPGSKYSPEPGDEEADSLGAHPKRGSDLGVRVPPRQQVKDRRLMLRQMGIPPLQDGPIDVPVFDLTPDARGL